MYQGQRVTDGPGRGRDQDLTPVATAAIRAARHLVADHAGGRLGRLTSVDAHTDTELLSCGPVVVKEKALHLETLR